MMKQKNILFFLNSDRILIMLRNEILLRNATIASGIFLDYICKSIHGSSIDLMEFEEKYKFSLSNEYRDLFKIQYSIKFYKNWICKFMKKNIINYFIYLKYILEYVQSLLLQFKFDQAYDLIDAVHCLSLFSVTINRCFDKFNIQYIDSYNDKWNDSVKRFFS